MGLGGRMETVTVTGTQGKPTVAEYGIIEESKTAIMEMATAEQVFRLLCI